MKKRMLICSFIFTMFVLDFLISNLAFGQLPAGLKKYEQTLLREDIRSLLPNFLNTFKGSDIQEILEPADVDVLLTKPIFLRRVSSKVEDQFIALLYVDNDLQTLFGDEQFYNVLKDSNEIEVLLDWFKTLPNTRPKFPQNSYQFTDIDIAIGSDIGSVVATDADGDALTYTLTGDDAKHFAIGSQTGHITVAIQLTQAQSYTFHVVADDSTDKMSVAVTVTTKDPSDTPMSPLKQSFAVEVVDKDNKPISDIDVTFQGTKDGNTCEIEQTGKTINSASQNQTTLTLRPSADENCVLTATVSVPLPREEPKPVVRPPPTAEPPLPPMYWIEGDRTIYYLPDGKKTMFPAEVNGTLTGGLAVDTVGRKVYWTEQTDTNTGSIRRANLNGTEPETVKSFSSAKELPLDIALDAMGRKLYWTNDVGTIQRFDLRKNHHDNKFKNIKGLKAPKHIAFDVETGKLCWTETDPMTKKGRIRITDPERQKSMPLVAKDLDTLGGIAVANDVVYWTEQTQNGFGSVRSRHRTGKDDKLLAGPKSSPMKIAVDPDGEKVYWTTTKEIQSVSLDAIQTVVTSEMNGAEGATGIALGGTAGGAASPTAPSVSSADPMVSVENTLLANYPNPFNPETWIPYQLSASADVSVSIYAVDGRLVRRLDLGHQSAGVYRSRSRAAYWDGRNAFGERVASGLYFYTLTAGDFTATRKMLIRK